MLLITLVTCGWVEPVSASPSRRRLLQALLLTPVAAACTSEGAKRPAPVDPDDRIRALAIARERALIEHYRATATTPQIAAKTAGLAEQHEQHLAALGAPSPSPSSSPTPAPLPPTVAQLAAAEHAAAVAHAAAALHASRSLAAVLASLAASEASHAVVLT